MPIFFEGWEKEISKNDKLEGAKQVRFHRRCQRIGKFVHRDNEPFEVVDRLTTRSLHLKNRASRSVS